MASQLQPTRFSYYYTFYIFLSNSIDTISGLIALDISRPDQPFLFVIPICKRNKKIKGLIVLFLLGKERECEKKLYYANLNLARRGVIIKRNTIFFFV